MIATTSVLLAVFVPVALLPGIVGELYRQFAVTLSPPRWPCRARWR